MTSYNDILVDLLNRISFPDNTNIAVLPLVPELDVLSEYTRIFNLKFPSDNKHVYNILKVYLVKCDTLFFDGSDIANTIQECIKNAWKLYNTDGNKSYVQRFSWLQESEFAVMEYEELEIVYNKEYSRTDLPDAKDGTLVAYSLAYKESTDTYKGGGMIYYQNNLLSVTKDYKSKPSESKLQKDLVAQFEKDYDVTVVID